MADFLKILESKMDLSPTEVSVAEKWFMQVERDNRYVNQISSGGGGGYVTSLDAGNVAIDLTEGITLRNPDTGDRTVRLDPDGDAWFGSNIGEPDFTTMFIISNRNDYNGETFGAGDLLIGSNSAGKGNMWWDASVGKLYFRSGTTQSVEIGAGGIVATWGKIGGWNIGATTLYDDNNSITLDAGNEKVTVGSGDPHIVIDGANALVKSSNYSADASGWMIDKDGNTEFNNIVARGSFRTSVFTYENIMAVSGDTMWTKAASEIVADVTTASPFTLTVKPGDDGATSLFDVGDVIRMKGWNGTEIIDVWGTVTASSTAAGVTTLTDVTLESGGTGKDLQKGMAVVNYGPTGAGVVHIQAGEQSTRIRIATHAGSPWTTETNMIVLGNMRGTYNTGANDRYGIGIGDYSSGNYISYNAETADQFILKAGAGSVTMNEDGLSILLTTDYEYERAYKFRNIADDQNVIFLRGNQSGDWTQAQLHVNYDGTHASSSIQLYSGRGGGGEAKIQFLAGNSSITLIEESDGTRTATMYADEIFMGGVLDGEVTLDGAISLGYSAPAHTAQGDVWINNDLRIAGGLHVGSTGTNPAADDIRADGAIGAGVAPPSDAIPQIFLDAGGTSYGMYSSGHNAYLSSNTYWNGSNWKTLETNKAAYVRVGGPSSSPFYVYYDATSRSAGSTNTFELMMAVTSGGGLGLKGGISIGHVTGGIDADGIRFYHGTTLRGDVEVQNNNYLRLNTHASGPIYTPRYYYSAGGFRASGTAATPNPGDVTYNAQLEKIHGGTNYAGRIYVPKVPDVQGSSWWGNSKSTGGTTITVSTTFSGIPASVYALNLRVMARDSVTHPSTVAYMIVGPDSTTNDNIGVRCHGNNMINENSGICNVTSNTIYVYRVASGSSTLDAWLAVHGYFI